MEPFKNFISEEIVRLIASHLEKHLKDFDQDTFVTEILSKMADLELKQRVLLIADKLHTVLPSNLEERNRIMVAMLHPDELDHAFEPSSEAGLCGWALWPLTAVIGQHGLPELDNSLEALRHMTMRGTAEFDVRPFIAHTPDHVLEVMKGWAQDSNVHVRRLASEGSRPRLPWGMRLQTLIANPKATRPILEALKDDPSEYVRRSVANHLNDIAKDHPELVISICQGWIKDASPEREKLIRHACRTLIKQGHPEALALFGILPPQITAVGIRIETPKVQLGNHLAFTLDVTSASKKPQKLLIDYVVHHKKANGTLSPKVFKWKQITLAPQETLSMSRQHAIRPITTRKYHSGDHALSLRINGRDYGKECFTLTIA